MENITALCEFYKRYLPKHGSDANSKTIHDNCPISLDEMRTSILNAHFETQIRLKAPELRWRYLRYLKDAFLLSNDTKHSIMKVLNGNTTNILRVLGDRADYMKQCQDAWEIRKRRIDSQTLMPPLADFSDELDQMTQLWNQLILPGNASLFALSLSKTTTTCPLTTTN